MIEATSLLDTKKLFLLGLVGIVVFYWFDTGFLNPVAIALMCLLVTQLVINKRILGVVIGGLFTTMSLYMCLALFSEFGGLYWSQSSDG